MSWKMYRWVWQVKSPIHIGWAPSGALNRTKLYIPARTIWGAFTAEIARRRANNSFPNYDSVGAELQKNIRFTYLYPAEKINGNWSAWLPSYKLNGFTSELPVWNNEEESKKYLSHRKFKKILLASLPSTAINPKTFSADESTLREIEVIKQYWKENGLDDNQVSFVGYVFIRDEGLKNEVFTINELFIGADTRYGFGGVVRKEDPLLQDKCFGKEVKLDAVNPVVKADTILGHVKANSRGGFNFSGSVELVQQWDKEKILISGLAWMPGSFTSEEKEFVILQNGFWDINSEKG